MGSKKKAAAVTPAEQSARFREAAKRTGGDQKSFEKDAGTDSIEGFFSVFKRGMNGIYQHCASEHLHRYLSEFDLRYNHTRGYLSARVTIGAPGGLMRSSLKQRVAVYAKIQ